MTLRLYIVNIGHRVSILTFSVGGVPRDFWNEKMCRIPKKIDKYRFNEYKVKLWKCVMEAYVFHIAAL